MGWRRSVRGLFTDARDDHASDAELQEEIRYHLEREAERQVTQGHDFDSARSRALEFFGDRARIMQATRLERGTFYVEKLMHDFRSAIRSLRKQLGFTSLAV